MSQLSFADVFNMARETADNPPVIQVRAQVAEVVPSVQRMMSEQHSRSRFIRVFKDTGRHLGRWEVFSDFLSLAASELDMARIRAPESIEHCRKICARYEASDIANMQEMFCMMVCALEVKFHDFLGAIFMELELGDNFRGQYFTPYSVQCLMARMLMPGVRDTTAFASGIRRLRHCQSGCGRVCGTYRPDLHEQHPLPLAADGGCVYGGRGGFRSYPCQQNGHHVGEGCQGECLPRQQNWQRRDIPVNGRIPETR